MDVPRVWYYIQLYSYVSAWLPIRVKRSHPREIGKHRTTWNFTVMHVSFDKPFRTFYNFLDNFTDSSLWLVANLNLLSYRLSIIIISRKKKNKNYVMCVNSNSIFFNVNLRLKIYEKFAFIQHYFLNESRFESYRANYREK